MDEDYSTLYVRDAGWDDFPAMYAMKSDPEDVKWSGFAQRPDPVKYQEWFAGNLTNPKRLMFIGFANRDFAAYAHFSRDNDSEPFDISYGVAPLARGKGYGSDVLIKSIAEVEKLRLSVPRYQTWIAQGNVGSEKAAAKADFYCSDEIKDQEFLFPERRVDGDSPLPDWIRQSLRVVLSR